MWLHQGCVAGRCGQMDQRPAIGGPEDPAHGGDVSRGSPTPRPPWAPALAPADLRGGWGGAGQVPGSPPAESGVLVSQKVAARGWS